MSNGRTGTRCRAGTVVVLWAALAAIPSFGKAHGPTATQQHRMGHHEDVRLRPSDTATSVEALIESFRRIGDDRYLDQAWSMLAPRVEEGQIETLMAAAVVAQSRHDFEHALELLDRLLAASPRHENGWLLKASVHLVRGEAQSATDACRQLVVGQPLVVVTCHARASLSRGRATEAARKLTRLVAAVPHAELPDGHLAWIYSVLGDLAFAEGRLREAVRAYERSLQLSERVQVRAALFDALLLLGDTEAATAALPENATALPLLVRRLIPRDGRTDTPNRESLLRELEADFDRWIVMSDWRHAREMARYYLDVRSQPELAARLARHNLEHQREPEDWRLFRRTQAVSGPAPRASDTRTKNAHQHEIPTSLRPSSSK